MARRIGIIAEYNPFHEGHAYQIAELKRRYPRADIVIFMSGDFVQRGEPAIISKNTRARAAIEGGADIVLSPPVFASVSSAGDFAYYGVTGLLAAGCDSISFGCEDTGIADLGENIKKLIVAENTPEYNENVRNGMREGLSFPAARHEAVRKTGIFPEDVFEKLKKPNNLLAFEYIRAICLLGREDKTELIPIKRAGMGYHEGFEDAGEASKTGGFPSAEAIRRYVKEKKDGMFSGTEKAETRMSFETLRKYGESYDPVFADHLSDMLFYRLLSMDLKDLIQTRDCGEDLANRIKSLLPQYVSFLQFTELVKTKDITYTRVSRVFINVLLKIGEVPKDLPYMYVLACGKEKRYILSDISNSSDIPILVNGKDEIPLREDRSDITASCLKTDRLAHELYRILARKTGGESLPEMFRHYVFV